MAGLGDGGEEQADEAMMLPPSVLLDRLERLLQEGSELCRYTPPEGNGWGVNGELDEEWHSFRERGDGSCTYDDQMHWWTEVPENGWSIAELARLGDLRKRASTLPQAELPTVATNPELFSTEAPRGRASSNLVAMAAARRGAAPVQGPGARAGGQVEAAPDGGVPISRMERLKLRLQAQKDYAQPLPDAEPKASVTKEAFKMAAAKAAATRGRAHVVAAPSRAAAPARAAAAASPATPVAGDDEEDWVGDGPTMQEEVSAASFLSAVKSRLTEWGKFDQYHEFVVSLTGDAGDVDVKNCVRILRGHDDLLRTFKYKFAPDADLIKVKAELSAEAPAEAPMPPAGTRLRAVKAELGAPFTPRAPAGPPPPGSNGGGDGPKPPPGPPRRGVKRELVKGEVKGEDAIPRPPKFAPGARRGIVTIGDESEEEEEDDDMLQDEASIVEAVRKGRDECVAQLAKLVFRKERSLHDGARERLATVRYATHRAACPRFPRELYILRGAPGVGKTDYAMQLLAESVAFDPGEELAARLTHVCAADDFFERFVGGEAKYRFNPERVELYFGKNETRARLAMEAGIHPVIVDCPNMRLWEMKPYVDLADRLGYVTTVVEPQEICERFDDLEYLASASDTAERRKRGKVVQRGLIAALLKAYEPSQTDLGGEDDPLAVVRRAERPEGRQRVVQAIHVPPPPPERPAGFQRGGGPGRFVAPPRPAARAPLPKGVVVAPKRVLPPPPPSQYVAKRATTYSAYPRA